jgi:hypothetical protein
MVLKAIGWVLGRIYGLEGYNDRGAGDNFKINVIICTLQQILLRLSNQVS